MLFVDVEPYRLTVQRHITGTILLPWDEVVLAIATIITISSGAPSVFLECTSYYLLSYVQLISCAFTAASIS